MKIGSLIYELGFHADTTSLSKFTKMIGDLNMSSLMTGTAMSGLFEMTKKFVGITTDTAMDMKTFTNLTGMNAQQMMGWSNAAEQAGAKAGAFESSIISLQQAMANTLRNNNPDTGLLKAYAWLNQYGAHISIKDSISSQYQKVRDTIQKVPADMRMTILAGMKMDPSMINFLMAPKDIWNKRFDQNNVLSKGGEESMYRLNAQWNELAQNFKMIALEYSTEIGPTLIKMTQSLLDVMKELKNSWAGKAFHQVGEGFGKMGDLYQIADARIKSWQMNASNMSDWIAQHNPLALHHSPSGGIMVVHNNTHVQTNNPDVASRLVKDAQTESYAQAHQQSGVRSR